MKRFSKLMFVAAALLIALSAFTAFASAEGEEAQICVTLRIEGVDGNMYYGEVKTEAGETALTAADVINKAAADSESLTVVGADAGYITEVNGLAAGKFGGWDGWLYLLNGEDPGKGVNECEVKDGDSIVLYYGDPFGVGMQYPETDLSKISENEIKIFSNDTVYDESYNASVVVNPVAGATVKIGDKEYTTDGNGIIKLDSALASGKYAVSIEKKAENGCPLVLRFAPDEEISFSEGKVTLRVEGTDDNLFFGEVEFSEINTYVTVAYVINKAAADSESLTVVGADAGYITEVNGLAAGKYGGWDGWLYLLNGEDPGKGVNDCEVKDGDSIVLYYGDPFGVGMQYPETDLSKISENEIKIFSNDTVYDENYNASVVVNPVAGATVKIGDREYTTDENGIIKLDGTQNAGTYAITIEKTAENGCPLVLRFAPGTEITINGRVTTGDEGIFGTAMLGILALIAGAAVILYGRRAHV
ncbi:MAG: DUF4430 domain-containing protein [Clostridia bacterium]|nr:DUF4430 domain-containing protein [Clostridia bacterium]